MPMNHFLERAANSENDQDEQHADQNDAPFGDSTSHANTRGHPDAGCRGQSMDLLAFVVPHDNAHAKKPNSGQDTLNNAAGVGAAGPTDGKDGQCRPDPDEAQRTNACGLAVKIAVKAESAASQSGGTEPQSYVEGVHNGAI
jgi:hypothetical protein